MKINRGESCVSSVVSSLEFSFIIFCLFVCLFTKLDLGATAPPHDGNHSTCGYLGVIWTL